ncbi:hypothetical protein CBOM_07531 [Ceraceosorus bombacis]|uniref:Uncharacterized protein n=1 Tax=Ceraceosorus bombacis TaxID=401625 RepID=A0A0P1BE66_9BASI|nr:hypothetical protein CBOM_07531 [Ceraceosorus bombacis]
MSFSDSTAESRSGASSCLEDEAALLLTLCERNAGPRRKWWEELGEGARLATLEDCLYFVVAGLVTVLCDKNGAQCQELGSKEGAEDEGTVWSRAYMRNEVRSMI